MDLAVLKGNLPKSIACLSKYSITSFIADAIAGITVGMVALPLAMAFAIASGVAPQAGIYCAITAGFLISALGGSRTQIGGPTGAFVVVVSAIVAKYGIDGLFTCTLAAGFLLVLLGLTGLGTAVKFIPRPVVIGFTNGIAVLIASTQIKDFFGLQIERVPGEFAGRLAAIIENIQSMELVPTALSASMLALMFLMPRLTKKVPGQVVALFLGTFLVWSLGFNVETIGSRYGEIPRGLPHLQIPELRLDLLGSLMSPILTIAMLGAIESLLSAVVADRMSGDKHNPNVELFAQGVANIVSPLFGGLPATGAIARTATNIRCGATTPVAGMLHAVTLLMILVCAAPLAKLIPLCVLAATLIVVAYNMGEWGEIKGILKQSPADILVWLITFALTVFADLTVAVEVGMILAALLYIRNVSATTTVSEVTPEYLARSKVHSLHSVDIPRGVKVIRIHGPFLFGSTDKLTAIEAQICSLPRVVILRLRNMTAIDGTGLHAIESFANKLKASGKTLILCGMRNQPARLMRRSGLYTLVSSSNIKYSFEAAITRVHQIQAAEGLKRNTRVFSLPPDHECVDETCQTSNEG